MQMNKRDCAEAKGDVVQKKPALHVSVVCWCEAPAGARLGTEGVAGEMLRGDGRPRPSVMRTF